MDNVILLAGIAFYLVGAIALMWDTFRDFYRSQNAQGADIISVVGCIVLGVMIWPVLFIMLSYKNYRDKNRR